MESQFIMSCYYYTKSYYSFQRRSTSIDPCWAWNNQRVIAICSKAKNNYWDGTAHKRRLKSTWAMPNRKRLFITKANESADELTDSSIKGPEKKGTIVGAVALIIGTSIGSGILALPKKTSPAGFIPSAISMIICWGFLLIEGLLLVEINVGLWKKKKKKREDELEIEIVSITTMAQDTLGKWGGNLATINYIFLAYTSMVAYTAKSGEVLSHLINLPTSFSGFFFTTLFTLLISVGGTQLTDQVNQWLTATMIGLLVVIEVVAVIFGGWSGLEAMADWGKVPATIPVIIFSLVYHDLAPVICAYLGGDLLRIRTSVIVGSFVPLIALLVWDAIALGLAPHANGIDPVELLMRVRWSGVSSMVEAFSLLAVGTSLIGTILGFSKFFVEQLDNFSSKSLSTINLEQDKSERKSRPSACGGGNEASDLREWWESNKLNFKAMAMAVAPPLFISTIVPDAFSAATDFAGGYCMTMLYGVLPPAMAWAMHTKEWESDEGEDDGCDCKTLVGAKPALIGVGLFACAIVMEQIQQDLSQWHH